MWTCEIRRDAAVFEELASWWESCPGSRQYPYLRHDWFRIWHEAFVPGGAKLEVEVWRRDGEVAAVLPLWRRGPRGASLSNSHSEVFDLITAEDEAYPVVANHLRRRPMTRLFRLDGSSPLLRSAGSQWYVDREIESLFIDLSAGYDAVWSGFSKNLRSNLRRNQHKLERLGELTFVDNADGLIDGAFEICLDLERRGWKGRNGTAILSRPETTRFYRGLAELAREKGWLRLSVLLISEKILAFELSLDYAGRRFWLKSGYDEGVDGAPGLILKWRAVEQAAAAGLSGYELGGEAEDWKRQWASGARPRVNVIALGDLGLSRAVGVLLRPRMRRPAYRRVLPGFEQ